MDGYKGARKAVEQAIRRLNALEYVILGVALVIAMAGGALIAFLLQVSLGASFRLVWVVASLVLFMVPALVAFRHEMRESLGRRPSKNYNRMDDSNGG